MAPSAPQTTQLPNSDPVGAAASRLGLCDTVSIIVGIVVGTAIFRSAPTVFGTAGGPGRALALWLAGGALAWCGAVCYAELATTYPRDGGDYEYLTRAFGPWFGFLFAWAQLTAIVSGNIAIMACALADYALHLKPAWSERAALVAVAPVIALSALNMLGLVAGKWTQNVLTAVKVVGIAGIVAAGLWAAAADVARPQAAIGNSPTANIGLALVFVLYAYGGWTHAAYVAAEVRDEERNLPRALMLGIAGITIIYLTVNAAYLAALGFDGARQTRTPAADVLELAIGPWGGRVISVLVMLSALGAINGMILTASRIYAVWGADYPALRWLAAWNRHTAAPVAAIIVQAAIAVALVLLVGTSTARAGIDRALAWIGLEAIRWGDFLGAFESLVACSAPIFWGLCLLTGIAVFVLRISDPTAERPFRVPLFPLPVLVFCTTCAFMLWAALDYAGWLTLIGILPLVVGGALGLILRRGPALRQ